MKTYLCFLLIAFVFPTSSAQPYYGYDSSYAESEGMLVTYEHGNTNNNRRFSTLKIYDKHKKLNLIAAKELTEELIYIAVVESTELIFGISHILSNRAPKFLVYDKIGFKVGEVSIHCNEPINKLIGIFCPLDTPPELEWMNEQLASITARYESDKVDVCFFRDCIAIELTKTKRT